MKKLLIVLTFCSFSIANAGNLNVEEIILKKFQTDYPLAQKVTWKEYDTYSEVYFEDGDIRIRVDYDLKGNIILSQRYYPERLLSPFILSKVKEKYKNVRINTITETSNEEGIKYNLTLEGEKHWYSIACDSYGNISVVNKLNKS